MRAADGDFKKIIVAVAVGMIALAIDFPVGGLAERGIVQAVGGGEQIAAREIDLHRYSP